jgi:Poly(3-hydroxybutyrate) depolymerase
MTKFILLLTLLVTVSSSSFAGVFTQKGSVDQFQWTPDYYTTGFKYDVFYYIPKKLKQTKDANSLIFLHGGGQSTMTRAGSARVAKSYIDDLKSIADQLGFIIVAPSGSGLNWGGHMRGMLPELAKLMSKSYK